MADQDRLFSLSEGEPPTPYEIGEREAMAKALILTVAMLLVFGGSVASEAAGPPVPISGTFFKGPLIGGVDRLAGQNVLLVRNEKGLGRLDGGVITGPADFTIDEEMVNFAVGGFGTLHAHVAITTDDGSVITLGLTGVTSAISTDGIVLVRGTWVIVSVVGPLAGLHGEGTFTGVEQFPSGETSGVFSGRIH